MTVFPLCSLAEEPYYYRVRVYSGEQGVIDGQESVTYENLDESYRVNFNVGGTVSIAQIVDGKQMKPVKEYQVTDIDASKYYIKGLREAGKDNTEILASHPIKQDMDYVIAYGMLGDSVDYTIRYVDANGNALLDDQTYYGNVGDRPVVAYQYIDGYQPQAYNITRTLTANPEENVLTFTYTPIPEPENTVNTTINTTTTTIPSNTGGTTNTNANTNTGNTVAPSQNAGTQTTTNNAGTGTATNTNRNAGATTNTPSTTGGGTGTAGNAATTPSTTGGTAATTPSTTGGGTAGTGGAAATTPTTPSTTTPSTAGGTGGTAGGGQTTTPTQPTTPSQPEEIQDQDVPMASPGTQGKSNSGSSTPKTVEEPEEEGFNFDDVIVWIILAVVLLAAAATGGVIYWRKRKGY
jgi:hypothetical protein